MKISLLKKISKGNLTQEELYSIRAFFVKTNKITKVVNDSINNLTINSWKEEPNGKRLPQKRNIRQM